MSTWILDNELSACSERISYRHQLITSTSIIQELIYIVNNNMLTCNKAAVVTKTLVKSICLGVQL